MNEYADHFNALLISSVIVIFCVVLHYEALRFLSRTIGIHVHKRIGVLIVMLGLLAAHVLEIIVFASGYMLMQQFFGLGHITNIDEGNFLDYIYYSSVVYTTVGFGDLLPVGAVRMLSAAEGLVGLAMITWSASFTFLAMKHFWPHPMEETKKPSKD
ncbi:Ion channel [Nitrosomonas aestuarii]|uniref:Ion channel n=1 Tax=Nitrosomonas aestuarii TaxID=52441 RepID=A0A1I3Z816_9PROT|nr:potassium channel family protein [Nitrosomonas aestuarii]SFK39689.1 Ion channel [Nitrosomonas aestuarii]